jgi:hypothetical protein
MPIPEWIVITPWLFGSGKFGTPCLRIQAEYFAPSVAFPTFMDNWNWPPCPPPGLSALTGGPEPLCVVDVAVVAVVGGEATLATPGEPPPPPQPDASSENAAIATTGKRMIRPLWRMMFRSRQESTRL